MALGWTRLHAEDMTAGSATTPPRTVPTACTSQDAVVPPGSVLPQGSLGVAGGTALYVAAVVGPGLLVLPGLAIGRAGPAALVSLGALLLLSVPLAATFAALGRSHPTPGGISAYVAAAFGARAAGVTGWWFYLGVPVGMPALGLFGGAYVATSVGGGRSTELLTAAVLLVAALAANAFGVRISGRVQIAMMALLAGGLVTIAALAAPSARAGHLTPFAPHGWTAVGPAALILVWSLTGWEAATNLAAEFRRPERDIARATGWALTIVAVLTLLVAGMLVLVLGPRAGTSAAPLADLLDVSLSRAGSAGAAALAVLVTFGTMNAYLASLAQLGSSMGRSGGAPRWLAGGGGTRRSLGFSTTLSAGILAAAAAFGWTTAELVLLCTASQVAVYAIGLAAALRLLPNRSPGWWCAAASTVPVLGLLVLCGPHLLAPAGVAAAALVVLRPLARHGEGARHLSVSGPSSYQVVQVTPRRGRPRRGRPDRDHWRQRPPRRLRQGSWPWGCRRR
jgi:amino acid efflux transporter